MIRHEDECVGCPYSMGCVGSACNNWKALHCYCDDCGDEVDDLYEYDGEQLCLSCLLDIIGARKVEE